MLISIVIPTYRRPTLLAEAVASVFAQEYGPIEIVVVDDSNDDESERMLRSLHWCDGVTLVYQRNTPPLRQAGNVNLGFDLANGERLALLHDDDRFASPTALAALATGWRATDDVVFGKLFRIEYDGSRNYTASEGLNRDYFKTAQCVERQLSAWQSALVGQFPNNGYLIRSDLARRVRYRDRLEFKTDRWCDFDFGLRLAAAGAHFRFVDDYITEYRRSPDGIGRQGQPTYLYDVVEGLDVPAEAEWARRVALKRLATRVVTSFIQSGNRRRANAVFWSSAYGWRNRLSPKGLRDAVRLALPARIGRHHQRLDASSH